MEYEQRILHNANLVYLEEGKSYKSYIQSFLPYALLKFKILMSKASKVENFQPHKLGGYDLVDVNN